MAVVEDETFRSLSLSCWCRDDFSINIFRLSNHVYSFSGLTTFQITLVLPLHFKN